MFFMIVACLANRHILEKFFKSQAVIGAKIGKRRQRYVRGVVFQSTDMNFRIDEDRIFFNFSATFFSNMSLRLTFLMIQMLEK